MQSRPRRRAAITQANPSHGPVVAARVSALAGVVRAHRMLAVRWARTETVWRYSQAGNPGGPPGILGSPVPRSLGS